MSFAVSAAISPAGPPPIIAIFTRYLFIVTDRNHTGLVRPKSVRRGAFNVGLESTTYERPFSRTNTTQCQNGRPCSRCHLMAINAQSGKSAHERNGLVAREARRPNCVSSRRTDAVSDQSLES